MFGLILWAILIIVIVCGTCPGFLLFLCFGVLVYMAVCYVSYRRHKKSLKP